MSDLLAFSIKNITGSELPRYYDLIRNKTEKEETPTEIISRFNKLRRKETE